MPLEKSNNSDDQADFSLYNSGPAYYVTFLTLYVWSPRNCITLFPLHVWTPRHCITISLHEFDSQQKHLAPMHVVRIEQLSIEYEHGSAMSGLRPQQLFTMTEHFDVRRSGNSCIGDIGKV